MKSGFLKFLMFSLCLVLAGCALPGRSKTTRAGLLSRPPELNVIWVSSITSLAALAPEVAALNDALVSSLNQTKMFGLVTTNCSELNGESGVKIVADIRSLKKVSEEARAWTGALAGRARVIIQATILDLKTGRSVGFFDIAGESGKSAFAGTTGEAIHRAAEQLTEEMLKLNLQTIEGER